MAPGPRGAVSRAASGTSISMAVLTSMVMVLGLMGLTGLRRRRRRREAEGLMAMKLQNNGLRT